MSLLRNMMTFLVYIWFLKVYNFFKTPINFILKNIQYVVIKLYPKYFVLNHNFVAIPVNEYPKDPFCS